MKTLINYIQEGIKIKSEMLRPNLISKIMRMLCIKDKSIYDDAFQTITKWVKTKNIKKVTFFAKKDTINNDKIPKEIRDEYEPAEKYEEKLWDLLWEYDPRPKALNNDKDYVMWVSKTMISYIHVKNIISIYIVNTEVL